jgi:hypothetical protein
MRCRACRALAGSVALLAAVWPSVGIASPTCRVVDHLDVSSLTPAWRVAVESLHRELAASLDAACDGVELALSEDHGGVRVTARARDGRETNRRVATPVGLSAVAFGLLSAAPGEALPGDVAPAAPDPLEIPPPPEPPPPRPPPPPPEWGVSVSASTGVRAELPSDVLLSEFEVRADLQLHGWLVMVHVRAAPIVLALPGPYDVDAFQESVFGLGFGRQVKLGRAVLALTGVADVAYVWVENDALNLSSERAQLRIAAVARIGVPVSKAVRLNAALDADASPTEPIGGPSGAGLPAYPIVTFGLRVGAEVLL